MADNLQLAIRITGDASGLKAAVVNANGDIKSLGATTKTSSAEAGAALNSHAAATDTVKRAYEALRNAVLAWAGIETVRKVVEVNTEFQRLTGSLTTVTGSSEAAASAFGVLENFAQSTPATLGQVTEAFVRLKSLGLDATEGALRSYGNTAAAMGKPMMQFIEAVGDAVSGENERLKEFGITSSDMGDKVAFTFQGITTVVGKSADQISGYLRSIGDTKFAGAMDQQMKTLGGAFSNFQDAVEKAYRAIGEGGLNQALVELTKRATDAVGSGDALARQFGAMLGAGLRTAADALALVGQNLDIVKAAAAGLLAINIVGWLAAARTGVMALSTAFAMSPIGIIATLAAVAAAAAGFVYLSSTTDETNAAMARHGAQLAQATQLHNQLASATAGDRLAIEQRRASLLASLADEEKSIRDTIAAQRDASDATLNDGVIGSVWTKEQIERVRQIQAVRQALEGEKNEIGAVSEAEKKRIAENKVRTGLDATLAAINSEIKGYADIKAAIGSEIVSHDQLTLTLEAEKAARLAGRALTAEEIAEIGKRVQLVDLERARMAERSAVGDQEAKDFIALEGAKRAEVANTIEAKLAAADKWYQDLVKRGKDQIKDQGALNDYMTRLDAQYNDKKAAIWNGTDVKLKDSLGTIPPAAKTTYDAVGGAARNGYEAAAAAGEGSTDKQLQDLRKVQAAAATTAAALAAAGQNNATGVHRMAGVGETYDSQGNVVKIAGVGEVQARASGGPTNAGQPYLIGEEGPEIFVPNVPGTVMPNSAYRQMVANNSNSATINNSSSTTMGAPTINIYGATNPAAIADAVADIFNRNGQLGKPSLRQHAVSPNTATRRTA